MKILKFQFYENAKFGRNKNKQWPQFVAVFTISIYSYLSGVACSWMSPAVPKLMANDSYIPMTLEETANLGIIHFSFISLFAPIAASISGILGRKRIGYLMSIMQITSWLLIGFATNVFPLYGSRAAVGIADSLFHFSIPYYNGETTEKHIRGRLGIISIISFAIGTLVINVVGYYLTISTTAFLMVVPPIIHLICFSFMPESPYWLIEKKRFDEAKKQLQILRWREDVDEEFSEIIQSIAKQSQEKGSYKDLFLLNYNRRAFLMALLCRMGQQISGVTTISNFMQFMFEEAGGNISRHVSASICALVSGISSLGSLVIIDRFGRRPLILISSGFCSVFLFAMAIDFYIRLNCNIDYVNWLPLLLTLSYTTFSSIGLALLPSVIAGEVFSSRIKDRAVMLIIILHGCTLVTATKVFQLLVDNVGLYSPFLVYGSATAVLGVIFFFIFIETKNKTLDEIQNALKY